MLCYRPFRNTDPPALVEIWRSRSGQPGLFEPLSVDLLEQMVLAKLYFEYDGLQVAFDGRQAVGLAHAGFGPTEDQRGVCRELGTTCLILVRPDCDEAQVADGLLAQSEAYLVRVGAKVLFGGAIHPLDAFYYGLYGGSELPGVLASDQVARRAFESRGYKAIDRSAILRGNLHEFQAPTDRRQMQIRRQMLVHVVNDPPCQTWWQACTLGNFERTRFELCPRLGGPPAAHAVVRNMDPTTGVLGTQSAGLIELEVDPRHRRQGLVVFLLMEAFHQLSRLGVERVEVQTMQHNAAALGLYRKLGFQQIDEGIVYRKDSSGA